MMNQLLDTLVSAYNVFNNEIDDGKNAAYELLSCAIVFNRSPYYAKDNCWNAKVVDGYYKTNGSDGKIDGYDIVSNEKEITIKLIQAKNSSQIKTPNIRDYFNAVKNYILDTSSNLTPEFESLSVVREKIADHKMKYQGAILKYQVNVVSNDINDNVKKTLIDEFKVIFADRKNVSINFVTNEDLKNNIVNIKRNISSSKFKDVLFTLSLDNETTPVIIGEDSVYVSTIRAEEIIKLIDKEFEINLDLTRLFQGNVRGFLGNTPVNDDIKQTILDSEKRFLPLNNGSVIVCDSIDHRHGNEYVIKNPIIVNGQQTFASIYKYAKNKHQKQNIRVVTKLISVTKNKEFEMELIAKASNQANKIDELDLLSNKPLILKLKTFFSDNGLYLKIKSGEILNDVFFKSEEVVDFSDLLKMWVSYELEYPSEGKTTKKNIKMFSDAYKIGYKGNKKRLTNELNFEKLAKSLLKVVKVMTYQDRIKSYFDKETYYEHAQYFINYLFKVIHGDLSESIIDNNIESIKVIIENQIENEKKRRIKNNQEYTHNNYFKSTRPVKDYIGENNINTLDDNLTNLLPHL